MTLFTKKNLVSQEAFLGLSQIRSAQIRTHQSPKNASRGDNFICQKGINSHEFFLLEEDYYQCDKCEYRCKWRGSLKRHIEMNHTEKQEAQFSCEICGDIFMFRRQLWEHRR